MIRSAMGRWTFVVVGCMLSALGNRVGGQTAKSPVKAAPKTATKAAAKPTPAGLSTLSGVYTNAQATRGRYVYLGSCQSCHSPQSHTGATFAQFWKGKPLSDLYSFVLERMPKNDPGTLDPENVADVTAYLLKMNAMPAGKDELYPDADSLKKFRIDLKAKGSTSTAKGAKP